MRPGHPPDDAEDAAQLIAFGMRPKYRPSRDSTYKELVRRYLTDEEFQHLTRRVAKGLGLRVLGAAEDIGIALAAAPGSVFETKMEDYVRAAKLRRERADGEKMLHGIIHLAVAALAFPRPDDLAKDGYLGRVSADDIDQTVREACRRLREKTSEDGEQTDAPTETPELERAWSAYIRRPETSLTKDNRMAMNSTKGMINRALNFLADQGFLIEVEEGTYRTTQRYQLQVRELAATNAFEELLSLGVVPMRTSGSLRTGEASREGLLHDV